MSRIIYITSPDYSRHAITVEKLVPSKRRPRVKRVVGVKSIPLLTKEQRHARKAIDIYG